MTQTILIGASGALGAAFLAVLVTRVRTSALGRELRRTHALADVSGSLDVDAVVARIADVAAAASGVEAVRVVVEPPGAKAAVAERARVDPARALTLTLHAGGRGVGSLQAQAGGRARADRVRAELEQVASLAEPALTNALRFADARRLADLDALTGLHNRRYFHETLSREVARAHRYGRDLVLVVLDLDDFKAINSQIGHLAGDAVIAEAAARLRSATRKADLGCRVGGDEFAVILPESRAEDARQLYRRVAAAVASKPIPGAPHVSLSAGVAELEDGEQAHSLFERADAALYRAKESGKARILASAGRLPDREPDDGARSGA